MKKSFISKGKNEFSTGKNIFLKSLLISTLVCCAGIIKPTYAANPAGVFDTQSGATTVDVRDNTDLSKPTLDYLHENNALIPQTDGYDSASGVFIEGTPILAPESVYTLTEATASAANTITKYEITEVTKYYDKTTGALVENPTDEDIAAGVYKEVQEKVSTPKYYTLGLKTGALGASNHVSWTEVGSTGENTITIKLPNGGVKYYKYEYSAPAEYTTTSTRITNITSDNVNKKTFQNISSSSSGGAIYNNNSNKSSININADFINNSATASDSFVSGGAIYNYAYYYSNATARIGNITGDFINNSATASVSSAKAYGGAIYNNASSPNATATIGSITGDFINNYVQGFSNAYGGAIYNYASYSNANANATIGNITGNFINNSATSSNNYAYGGAIYNYAFPNANATIGDITGDFINNSSISTDGDASGGAIYNAADNSGAVATIGNITGNFINNSATGHACGGAIYNIAISSGAATIGDITGDFINNSATSTSKNACGGAIYNDVYDDSGAANIGNIAGDFINNSATSTSKNAFGGAIYNDSGTIGSVDSGVYTGGINSAFIGNYVSTTIPSSEAKAQGGAIYNLQGMIANLTKNFLNNYAQAVYSSSGGAIYNDAGTIGNIAGDFINNRSISELSPINGGAIDNYDGTISNITGDFTGNYGQSNSNSALGGAIYNRSSAIEYISGTYTGNYVVAHGIRAVGGAIGNRMSMAYITTITADFINNYAMTDGTGEAAGGAIWNIEEAKITSITGNFTENNVSATGSANSAWGGAIYNSNSTIGVIDGSFTKNYATSLNGAAKGGAIWTNADMTLQADGHNNVIKDNWVSTDGGTTKDYQAVWVDSYSATLTMNAINGGSFEVRDNFNGASGYGLHLTGDGSGKIDFYDGLYNAKMTTDNVKVNLNYANNEVKDFTMHSINIDEATSSVDLTVDVDLTGSTPVADKIITTADSNGTLNITNVNFVGDVTPSSEFKVQVLETPSDTLQLALADALISTPPFKIGTQTNTVYDTITANVDFDHVFKIYDHIDDVYGNLSLGTTSTTNDSLSIVLHHVEADADIIDQGSQGDTLRLLAELNTTDEKNFNFRTSEDVYNLSEDLTSVVGTLNINGVEGSKIDFDKKQAFVVLDGANLNVKNVILDNTLNTVVDVKQGATAELTNVEFSNNIYISEPLLKSAGDLTINVSKDTDLGLGQQGLDRTFAELSDGTLTLNSNGANLTLKDKIVGNDSSQVTVNGDGGTFNLNSAIENTNVKLNNINLDMINNQVEALQMASLQVGGNLNLNVDADLANVSMDRLPENTTVLSGAMINVDKINLLSDATQQLTSIPFAYGGFKDSVKYIGSKYLDKTTQVTAFAPIYKYGVSYDNQNGNFLFVRGGGASTSSAEAFNPAVLTAPVAAQMGGYMGMINNYENAFAHIDMNMLKPLSVRKAEADANKYAIADTPSITGLTYNQNEMNSKGIWYKPFANYDSVRLKNGPKVNNFSYGSFVGGDSETVSLKNGFTGVISSYISYMGSHQSFSGNSVYQNGGSLGVVGSLYKNNFFTGMTVTAGASVAEASTMYGHEDFPMLMAGIASKTGYNFEMKDGKYIIQPSMLLSYTFVNTFDYTNNAGVRIDSDPLHAIQISPNFRFIMNTKNGWQPYATVGMNWNIMDKTKFSANEVELPNMSVKPYIQYGLGIQKSVRDNFTGYGQFVIRNGGRNGIGVTFGFRWLLGKESKKEKVQTPAKEIKQAQIKTIESNELRTSAKTVETQQQQRTIIKQFSQQKALL